MFGFPQNFARLHLDFSFFMSTLSFIPDYSCAFLYTIAA